jgi:tetratricopeptide (TPR) repeat protein
MAEIPEKAKKSYNEAVRILTEDMAERRALRGTDIVIENLLAAIKEHEEFFEAWRLLGEVYLGTEETLKSYLALRRAYELNESDSGVATLLGEAALIMDRPELALKYLNAAHKDDKVPLAARKLLALTLSRSEKWEEALRAFGEALAEDPSDGDIRRDCSRVLNLIEYRPEAGSVLADYLDPFRDFTDKQPAIMKTGWIMAPHAVLDRLSPGAAKRAAKNEIVARAEDYRAWYYLGNVFLDGEEYEAAVACYKRALRVHPDYHDALHNMGIALEELGRTDDALQMYDSAVEADPDSPEAYLSIAELLEDISPDDIDEIALNYLMYYRLDPEAEGFDEFEKELRSRLEASPDIAQILLLSHIYLLRDEIEKAETLLKLIETAGAEEATYQWLRGRIYQAQEDFERAEKSYNTGLEIAGEEEMEAPLEDYNVEAQLRFDLAMLLEETDHEEKARKILEEDREILDADGLSLLAELLLESDPQAAEDTWHKALNIDPEHIDSLLGLAERMIETERIEEAIILLERALKVDPEDADIIGNLRNLYPMIGAPELSPPEIPVS